MAESYTGDEGDDALAAGLDVMDGTEDRRDGWKAINKTRDMIAQRTSTVLPVASGGTGATTVSGAQSALDLEPAAEATVEPGKLARFDGFGRLVTATPTSSSHVVRKDYMEAWGYSRTLIDAAFESRDSDISDVEDGQMSTSVYNRDLGGVTRRATWTSYAGQLGYASSLREHKQDITPAGLAREVLTAIPIVQYRYKAQVALQQQDPEHHVAVEIGTLADDLHALGLWQFVTYDGHGEDAAPQGVHYELLGLAAIALGQILADELDTVRERLDSIEDRLTVLEG